MFKPIQLTGAQAIVEALLRYGITAGFGIPSIHNITIYEALRQEPNFQHWVVRHEQAAAFAADGFARRSGRPAAVFASTGPGNLFTLVPLLESFQTDTPVLVVGTNVASPLLDKPCNALHETPRQLDLFQPLTRLALRVTSPDAIPEAIARAVEVLHGPTPGPAFVEIPHDFLSAPVAADFPNGPRATAAEPLEEEIAQAAAHIAQSQRPTILIGSGALRDDAASSVRRLAETLQAPVLTTTAGKGLIPDDHPLAMGCIARLGAAQDLLLASDLLISFGARFTEFDTGQFRLQLPARHLQADESGSRIGRRFPVAAELVGNLNAIAQGLLARVTPRASWWDAAKARDRERQRLSALGADGYAALIRVREALDRGDVVVHDQSILNYWAAAFFPVFEPRTFLYPSGSGTLGYGLPAAIGAACAAQRYGLPGRVVCVTGDGGFQYTSHELATLGQHRLPVKILLVNDSAYGVIGYLQRLRFSHTHEVSLKNPDFCRLAEAFGIWAKRVADCDGLGRALPGWLGASGAALLELSIALKAPWEIGAIFTAQESL
ncbi:MAG TPA: thiamine pyrophosphate-binding protein [Candidatus Acidoferrales bacterium]|nr:thiamine pyrophosphate-binding protein [Candidatus Acidoferrales bacterium]